MYVVPGPHEIAEALRLDPMISQGIYQAFRDHIGNLPAIIGEARLSSPFDSHTLTELSVAYMRSAIDAGVLDEFDASLQSEYLDMVEAALPNRPCPDTEFESTLITPPSVTFALAEQEHVLNSLNLSDDLKARYRDGTLTIGDVVRLQPGLFIRRY